MLMKTKGCNNKNSIWLCLILIILFQPVLAVEMVGDKELKAKGLISRVYDEQYTISRDNTIDFIYTYKDKSEKTFSAIPVFPNGTMVVPNIGEEFVFGKTLDEIQSMVLSKNSNIAKVEIFVHRIANNVSVLGEVRKPGSYKLNDIKTIYDAIAKAGGFSDVAKRTKVQLIRQRDDGSRYSYNINFPKEVYNAYAADAGIGEDAYLLKEGDLIYVNGSGPRKVFKLFKQALSAATFGVFAGLIGGALN